MSTLREALVHGTTTRFVSALAMVEMVACGGRVLLGRGEDTLTGGSGRGAAGASSVPGVAGGAGGVGSRTEPPTEAGRAGESPTGGVIDLAQTVKLGLHGSTEVPAAAFSGDTLGVVVVAGVFGQRSVVLALEDGTSFEQFELDRAPHVDVPALVGDHDGFYVAWWSTLTDGWDSGSVHLARLSPEGSLLSTLLVAENVPGKHCDVAIGAGTAAVACGTGQFGLCTEDACEPVALPNCEEAGDTKVAWDGEAFAAVRTCRAEGGVSSVLRYSRISPSGEIVLPESDVIATGAVGARPGLMADDGRLLVVFAGRLYALDAEGHIVSDPVELSSLESDGASLADFESIGEIVRTGERLLAFHAWHLATTAGPPAGDSAILALDSSLTVLGKAGALDDSLWGTGVATSASGRSVVAGIASSAVAVAHLDTDTFTLSDALYLDGVPEYPTLSDVYCDSTHCRVALTTEAVASLFGTFASSAAEVDVDLASADPEVQFRSFEDCGDQSCRVWFTGDGATALVCSDEVRWVKKDGTVAWNEPPPLAEVDFWQGPFGRESPSLMLKAPDRHHLVSLSEQGMHDSPLDPTYAPILGCGEGWYLIRSREDGQQLQSVDAAGLGPSLAVIPYDSAKADLERYICGDDQVGLVELDADGGRRFQRVSRAGDILPDVLLTGQVLADANGPDGVFLAIEAADTAGGATPQAAFALMRIPMNGPTEEFAMDLPEPGWVDAITVNAAHVSVVWHTGRALWLSTYRRQP